MIKIEHVVLPSQEQIFFVIEGMRNPLNSWDRMDTIRKQVVENEPILGFDDMTLAARLSAGGEPHRKYMRMINIGLRITAPIYWWKEFDTYKVGTVRNSTSTMHKIHDKRFERSDFSFGEVDDSEVTAEYIESTLYVLNLYRDLYLDAKTKSDENPDDEDAKKDAKRYWYTMIQLLPSSYNQTSNVMLNYETLCNIYKWRKGHKLYEWRVFCDWIEHTLPFSKLITDPKSIIEKED